MIFPDTVSMILLFLPSGICFLSYIIKNGYINIVSFFLNIVLILNYTVYMADLGLWYIVLCLVTMMLNLVGFFTLDM